MSFGKFKGDENGSSTPSSTSNGKSEAFLGKGTKVVGTLSFTGPVELEGVVEGEVIAKEMLTIGEGAAVNAKISGTEIVVKGNVSGDIVASKRLTIKRPARIIGNIASPLISIEEGVHFEGRCSMNISSADSKGFSVVAGGEKSVGAAA